MELGIPLDSHGHIDPTPILKDFEKACESVDRPIESDRLAETGRTFGMSELGAITWEHPWKAVYAIALEPGYKGCADSGRVLKVGRATLPSRLKAHLSRSDASSLASSLQRNPILHKYLGITQFTNEFPPEEWLRSHCYAVLWEFSDSQPSLPARRSDGLRMSALDALERYVRGRLGPVFEGSGTRGLSGRQHQSNEESHEASLERMLIEDRLQSDA